MSPFSINRMLWLFLALLCLAASGIGVLAPTLYRGVVDEKIEPGVFTRDIVAIMAAVILILLAITSGERDLRRRSLVHGIVGFLFYAHAVYCIERAYTWFYPMYVAIFGLSFFSLAYAVSTVPAAAMRTLSVKTWIRVLAAIFGMIVAVVFNVIWISQLVPLMRTGQKIEYTYSIHIIDLGLVMPAFLITAIMALRRHPTGLMGLPALFVVGAGILSPLALAELLKPIRFGMPSDELGLRLYLVLSILFLVFAIALFAGFGRKRAAARTDAWWELDYLDG